ncbi:preprotein translocase subunit YajC [Actinotalea sp. M2MS4P-6]|uniref:preprotein translocase subunit YajC n=1 Tax=Actinotalea sp. M2MS4P-6 TaxID=2983762 RepID=UPI0021E48664|nr:preprotein translocase subunit YajC [Actinotalea sp. M2MS4P-6]MCV2394533.1 preprotein translocase subunit YajC [Actinotalea sp. M2MS4P-6]
MDPLLLVMLVVLFGGMWFMSNRSRKQQQAAAAFRDHLEPGQEVMTGSGMYGTVVGVEGDVVTLETSPGVETRWYKPAIAKLVEHPEAEESYDEDDEYDEDDYDGDEYEDDVDDDAEYDDVEDDTEDEDGPDETPGMIEDNRRD